MPVVDPNVRPSVSHIQGAPPQERDDLEMVMACIESFEKGIGQDLRDKYEARWRQYRGYARFRNAWEASGPNDRDEGLREEKKTWGANLHIPLSYATVEKQVPRAIAHRPRMLYLPGHPRWEENVDSVRYLIDRQQDNIDIDLPFQAVMRSGMVYGIGWGKSFWKTEYERRRRIKQMTLSRKFVVGRMERRKTFDDPFFEDIDPRDMAWDALGFDVPSCEWIAQRCWVTLGGCLDRIESGAWDTASAGLLDEAKLRSMGSGTKHDEATQRQMETSGLSSYNNSTRGEQVHEVWEWHDGSRVLTVLDRSVLVQDGESPCVGMFPFVAYRPTPQQKQMNGIGELEPIEHLQRELDSLRSARSDARTIALCAGYAYDDGAIEEEDLVFGPAAAIRVTNARPSDAIMPLPVNNVPGAAFQDEQVIRGDMDSVTGVNDNPEPGAQTATEAQLVQASLSKRIELKSRRFEIEVVRHAAKAFLYLDQRMILSDRPDLRQPDAGLSVAEAAQTGRWKWVPIGPGELQGEFEIIPEGGSMAAENVPQMRQDAVQKMQLFGQNPHVDQRRLLLSVLKDFGEKDPEAWLSQQNPPVPPAALEALQQMGVDSRLIERAVEVGRRSDPMFAQDGPDQQQVGQMMGAAA